MKTRYSFFLLIIALLSLMPMQPIHGQHTSSKVTINGKVNMKRIPTNIGLPYVIMQECDTSLAPELRASNFTFQHARMGKIRDARVIYEMENVIVRTITIQLHNRTERDNAIRQALRQFGPSNLSRNEMLNVCHWNSTSNGMPIVISLSFTNHEANSEMLIKLVE